MTLRMEKILNNILKRYARLNELLRTEKLAHKA
jgi:hypothetical protein